MGDPVLPIVRWLGPVPTACDTCGHPLHDEFYDEKTSISGKWGCLCSTCHTLGPGLGKLGTGWGQKYEKQLDGRWLKTDG